MVAWMVEHLVSWMAAWWVAKWVAPTVEYLEWPMVERTAALTEPTMVVHWAS